MYSLLVYKPPSRRGRHRPVHQKTRITGWCTRLLIMARARGTNRKVVYETLREQILTMALPPGAALSENELAAVLGVSRTPVRESLILLADEGLVQVFPQVGTFVS